MAFTSIEQSDLEWALTTATLPGTDGPNKLEPSAGLKSVGMDFEQFITCEELNWLFFKYYKAFEELESRTVIAGQLPIGSIYQNATDSRNPAVILGYGTWQSRAGTVLIGAGTHTDARGEELTFTAGESGGEYKHVLTISEAPTHTHQLVTNGVAAGTVGPTQGGLHSGGGKVSSSTTPSGGDQAHNNMMPYRVVYCWERIA